MKFLKEYFVFSSSERRGIFAFSVIILLMIFAYAFMPVLLKSKSHDFSQFDKEIEGLIALNSNEKKENSKPILFTFNPNTISKDSLVLLGLSTKQAYNVINYRTKFKLFESKKDFKKLYSIPDSLYLILENKLVFNKVKETKKLKTTKNNELIVLDENYKIDPNIASISDFVKIGLSLKQANNIVNYRTKVGSFKAKEELKKLYTLKEKDYLKLEPYLEIYTILDVNPKDNFEKVKEYETQTLSIDINTAAAQKFQEIRGIGAKTAQRIIELREELGGFYDGRQLLEIYRIDTSVILNNLSNFRINLHKINKIDLNKVTFKELLSHPYISYSQTRRIITYREMHGDFNSVEEILGNNLIKEKHYRKIVHYLMVE